MSLTLISPPSAEPVSLAEAKAHLKIDNDREDALIATLITAARARAEWHTGRSFVTQTWLFKADHFPAHGIAELPLPPLQSVLSVALTAGSGIRTVLDAAAYDVDRAAGRVIFHDRPQRLRRYDCLEIAYTAGYGEPGDVPLAISAAILQIVADLYSHRGDEEAIVTQAGQALLAPFRVFKL